MPNVPPMIILGTISSIKAMNAGCLRSGVSPRVVSKISEPKNIAQTPAAEKIPINMQARSAANEVINTNVLVSIPSRILSANVRVDALLSED